MAADCMYCGLPLSGENDGWAHAACERVVTADNDANYVHDNGLLDEVEERLRAENLCPWQIRAHGWEGDGIYCGRGITDTGGDEPDLFCLEHGSEALRDWDGAAQERAERTLELLQREGMSA